MTASDQTVGPGSESTTSVKQCCARLYESDFAKILLGDSFHPGGLALTERLGSLLGLGPNSRALDVASGPGSSAFFLTERFGCQFVGVDYSERNVQLGNETASEKRLSSKVRFECGDAEHLHFADAWFDAIICECAFCTFADKPAAACEFARVLRREGRVGVSDLTRAPVLPKELDSLLAWISCIADAQPAESYAEYFRSAGLQICEVENHDGALIEMIRQIRVKLLSAEVLTGLGKLNLPGVNFTSAKQMAVSALEAAERGQLGYAIVTASR